nr:disks large-associated protein 2-like isoform X2 [Petromyzon marinus]XP_032810883.1 disks large-associated protein 2-like isoform X2 [Petromyzon marinus]
MKGLSGGRSHHSLVADGFERQHDAAPPRQHSYPRLSPPDPPYERAGPPPALARQAYSLAHRTERHPAGEAPHHRYSLRGAPAQPECAEAAAGGGGTFPRSHYGTQFDGVDDFPPALAVAAYQHPQRHAAVASGRVARLPPGLLDQLERQLPPGRDGFCTLQYQRANSESPGRIRHLVHSVQRLFAKSHSMEASAAAGKSLSKSDSRSTAGLMEDEQYHHHQLLQQQQHLQLQQQQQQQLQLQQQLQQQLYHQATPSSSSLKQSRRSKSRERKESRLKGSLSGWWSSDDNLDADSVCDAPSVPGRRCRERPSFHEFPLRPSKSIGDVKCAACAGGAEPDGGRTLRRGAWSTMTVSQAPDAYRDPLAASQRTLHRADTRPASFDRMYQFLQVPKAEWGYPLAGRTEIPCRRMRSGSYMKAIGDEEGSDSDASPRQSPRRHFQASYRRPSSDRPPVGQSQSYLRAVSEASLNRSLDSLDPSSLLSSPKLAPRSRGYERSRLSQPSYHSQDMNGQYGSLRDSAYESQAVEALDLPGCFRTRSHSYLRAIQAGFVQEGDCLLLSRPSVSSCTPPVPAPRSGVPRPSTLSCLGVYKKSGPPVPPRLGPKPFVSVGTQSSTESTSAAVTAAAAAAAQDVYLEHMPQQGEVPVRDGLREPWGGGGSEVAQPQQKPWSRTNCVPMSASLESVRASRDGPAAGRSSPACRSMDRQASGSTDGPESLVSDESGKSLASPGGKKRPSVAVQVDIPDAAAAAAAVLSDAESGESGERYHSIGVQVEDERRAGRYARSNSVTTAVQADLEVEDLARLSVFTPEKVTRSASSSSRASHSRSGTPVAGHSAFQHVAQQGSTEKASQTPASSDKPSHREAGKSGGRAAASSVDRSGVRRSSSQQQHSRAVLTQEDCGGQAASLDGGPPPNGGRVSPCVRDGRWFMRLLQSETERLQGWCSQIEVETQGKQLSEEVLGKIRSAVGSAQLLISQKFKQFHGLCQQNLDPDATPRPTSTDLAGFWDMLQLSVEDVSTRFHELQQLKVAGWTQATPPPPSAKESGRQLATAGSVTSRRGGRALRGSLSRDKSSSESADKQRAEEARKRLMAAKRAAAGRQSSATESSDNIEIYIPEAQTRL